LATALAKAGDSQANAVFTKARAVTRSIPEGDREWSLCDLSIAFAQAGRYDQACQVADSIRKKDKYASAWALSGLAAALAHAKRYDQARQVANSIEYNEAQAEALIELAVAFAKVGDSRANVVFSEAFVIVKGLHDPEGEQLRKLATALAQTGHYGDALGTLESSDLNVYLATVSGWASLFDQIERGLSVPILREAIKVAGWIHPGWRTIHELIAIPSGNSN
jgi:hypothetical protein